MTIRIYFDGESRPNTRRGKQRACLVIVWNGSVSIVDKAIGTGTAEFAEWKALLMAAEMAATKGWNGTEIVGDCQAVIRCADGWKTESPTWQYFRGMFADITSSVPGISLAYTPRGSNLAGRFLEAGDGQHFRNGLRLLEGIEEFAVRNPDELPKLSEHQRKQKRLSERRRLKRRAAERAAAHAECAA